jgi:hypothetical protein
MFVRDAEHRSENDDKGAAPTPEFNSVWSNDLATAQAIAACGGDAREAVKALIVANQFLETDLEKLRAVVSTGYAMREENWLRRPTRCRVIARIPLQCRPVNA